MPMPRPDETRAGDAFRPSSPVKLLVLGVLALLAFVGLVALGTWQVERRAWKLDLIARVDSRVHAPAVQAPPRSAWSVITAASDEYRHVQATGAFLYDREVLVQATTRLGPGFWVMTPLRMAEDTTILVNRGFVPGEQRDRASRAAAEQKSEAAVSGLLRLTEPGGGFLRSNDPAANRWYSRDVSAIAMAQQLNGVAPYFIDADAAANPGGLPVGGLTVVAFPNNHLVYAITWYVLALMVAGGAAYVAREEWRGRKARR
jgi:surfeit locus 1 family protein